MNNTIDRWTQRRNNDKTIDRLFAFLSPETVHDATYKHLEFGTAGMRGLLGPGNNRMNPYTVRRATRGFALYLKNFGDKHKKQAVAIAYDNRHFSYEFAMDTANYLASFGIASYVFTALRPTPELSFAVRELNCVGGIMITASHNPREYNGYKVYDETGCQLVPDKIAKVITFINEIDNPLELEYSLSEDEKKLIDLIDKEIDIPYIEAVSGITYRTLQHPEQLRLVFTPQHGTAYPFLPELLKKKGYEVHLVEDQCTFDPDFANTVSPNPEDHRAYIKAIDLAKKIDADLVLTTDPDADRMGIVVKHQGEYVYVTGNQGGSILQQYIYESLQDHQTMPDHPVMFNTIVTSDLGEQIAGHYGVACEKTLTGFKYIGSRIDYYDHHPEKTFVFGYEESYGYLLKPFVRDKDAFQACSILAEAAAYYKEQGKTLIDVLNDLFNTYGTYLEEQVALTLTGEEGVAKIKEILNTLREDQPLVLGNIKVVAFEDYLSGQHFGTTDYTLKFPRENVLKFYLEDGSWVAIRPSGTEPKCKFYYCVKADTLDICHYKFNALKANIEQLIQ